MAQTTVLIAGPRTVGQMLWAFLCAIGNVLITLGEAGPLQHQIRKLQAMTDEDLASKGLTRDGEIRRIFGARYLL